MVALKQKKKPTSQIVGDKFRSLDQMGAPISVLYQGNDSYQTKVGACASVMILIIVLVYSSQKIQKLVNRLDPDTLTQTTLQDTDKMDPIRISDYHQLYMIGLFSDVTRSVVELPEEIGKIDIQYIDRDLASENFYYNKVPVATQKCEQPLKEKDMYDSMTESEKGLFGSLDCLITEGTELQGSSQSLRSKFIEIEFLRCSSETNNFCASDEELTKFFNYKRILVYAQQSYVDFEDYENHVKYTTTNLVSSSLSNLLPYTLTRYFTIETRLNTLESLQEVLQFVSGTELSKKFTSIVKTDKDVEAYDESSSPINIRIIASPEVGTYKLQVYSILDAFGDIGGLTDAIMGITAAFIGLYAQSNYYSSIVQSTFSLQKRNKRLQSNQPRNDSTDHTYFNSVQISQDNLSPGLIQSKPSTASIRAKPINHPEELHASIRDNNTIVPDLLYSIRENLLHRKRFNFDFSQQFRAAFSCCCSLSSRAKKRAKLFSKAQEQIDNQLDIEKIMKVKKTQQIILQTIFSKYQRQMIKLQRSHLLSLDDINDDVSLNSDDCQSNNDLINDQNQIDKFIMSLLMNGSIHKTIDKKLVQGLFHRDGYTKFEKDPKKPAQKKVNRNLSQFHPSNQTPQRSSKVESSEEDTDSIQ